LNLRPTDHEFVSGLRLIGVGRSGHRPGRIGEMCLYALGNA
jgi:hypothetical protein